jgi:hypothetical protein
LITGFIAINSAVASQCSMPLFNAKDQVEPRMVVQPGDGVALFVGERTRTDVA